VSEGGLGTKLHAASLGPTFGYAHGDLDLCAPLPRESSERVPKVRKFCTFGVCSRCANNRSVAEVAPVNYATTPGGCLRAVLRPEKIVVITVDGRQVAVPCGQSLPAKMGTRGEFVHRFSGRQADAALARGPP